MSDYEPVSRCGVSVWSNMKQPASTTRRVSTEEAVTELTDILNLVIRALSPGQREHLLEQLEAYQAERARKKQLVR